MRLLLAVVVLATTTAGAVIATASPSSRSDVPAAGSGLSATTVAAAYMRR